MASCSPNHTRRRLVALLIVGLVTAVVVVGFALLRAAAVDDGVPERTTVVEVHQGETLWELAERVAPQSPPHAVVERIRELNGLRGSTVHPGQPLLVPDSG
jgi:predicted Zn-dependent protease